MKQPYVYISTVEQIYVYFLLILHLCISYIANILVCVNEFIFSLLPFFSDMDHEYTNANIDPWRMRTQLSVFSTSKHSNVDIV